MISEAYEGGFDAFFGILGAIICGIVLLVVLIVGFLIIRWVIENIESIMVVIGIGLVVVALGAALVGGVSSALFGSSGCGCSGAPVIEETSEETEASGS